MTTNKELMVTSFDHDDLKTDLINFLKSTEQFGDFDYEGSYINTLVDLLVRNTEFSAYMANFMANESFLDSAQIRSSVVSHAQKLSYTPRSRTASRLVSDVTVTPSTPDFGTPNITMDAGTSFLVSDGSSTYSFVNLEDYVMGLDDLTGNYTAEGVYFYQGQRITSKFIHNQNESVVIPNPNIDTSTIIVSVSNPSALNDWEVYKKATAIQDTGKDQLIYFLGENTNGLATIDFGQNILGTEPAQGSVVHVTYINVEPEHANGAASLVPASTIGGYSNITTNVVAGAYGGAERESIDEVRFTAPKVYQSQNRALTTTDYIPLIKSQFPYIKSVIVWGGESNNPPKYGKVLMSFITNIDRNLTKSTKDEITSYLKDYNVGSITPEIIDPIKFGLNLDVYITYDGRRTSGTFSQVASDTQSIINKFSIDNINEFGKYYNDAQLVSNIMKQKGMDSVDIKKTVNHTMDVLRFPNPIYNIDFGNAIEEGSVSLSNFMVDINGINHQMYDLDGDLIVEYKINGVTFKETVGTIDYETGYLSFIINMIQSDKTFSVYVKPMKDNFYIENNKYLVIDKVNIGRLNGRT